MNPSDYEFLSDFLMKASGLNLGEGKAYLLESRLIPVAQSLGLSGIEELVQAIKTMPTPQLKTSIIEAMTTNETLFFRDKKPFDELANLMMPKILEAKKLQRKVRIWCAASSSGQEPYSIAMQLKENIPELSAGWNVEIVATDLDNQILAKAKEGQYTQFEVQRGLSIQMLMKYFEKNDQGWQIKPEIRSCITWKQLNLLDNFSHLGQFDVIFCRNVLIYFDTDRKKQILDRMATQLPKHGYLVLGGAETVLGICDSFNRAKDFRAAVYNPAHAGVGLAGTASIRK